MADLLLTLGHNASAVAISREPEGSATIVNAYELERLTGVKSDSRFPVDAIEQLVTRGVERFERVFVTHWEPGNNVDLMKSKYWDRSVFGNKVQVVSQEHYALTHHDCHAHAALMFAGSDFPTKDSGLLVVDGFGSMSEHLSYYRLTDSGHPVLLRRYYGYSGSMGLMYQYATAYLGMKMHEDEYKLLGYAAHIDDIGVDRKKVGELVFEETKRVLKIMRSTRSTLEGISLDALPAVQEAWADRFDSVIKTIMGPGLRTDSFEARVLIGFFAQSLLEAVISNLFATDVPRPKNLIATGGVMFNVALGRRLMGWITGKLCIMPIAGDQGNSLGLWKVANKRLNLDLGDLCWGKRNFEFEGDAPAGLIVVDKDGPEVAEMIETCLDHAGFVNVVRGNMEFGPRALCNTSTLAVPSDMAVVDEINRINGRNTVMPFAPVIWHEQAQSLFPDLARLHRSGDFMICALDYANGVGGHLMGAALRAPDGKLTGRPQVYRPKYEGDSVATVIEARGVLINTSFNVHGVPICCDMKDVIHSHQAQHQLNDKVRTIVIKGTA